MNVGMDAQTITGVSLVFLIVNLSLVLVGLGIKKCNLSDLIIGFDPKKDDKVKVSSLVGNNILFAGVISFLGEAIYYVCKDKISPVFYVIYFLIVIAAMLINIYIRWHKLRTTN